ncbi:hypothetical protein BCR39DRAFT_470666 [Naematelia encephala]|uniref:RNB domain-containing protein n=1 Tax=Naematelia encephala TaxID=71784 RepID=A0A1Y2AV60_9TREE|nr:hypothetical protein BCR39DRAFT_470666 [Naematelia encephala]
MRRRGSIPPPALKVKSWLPDEVVPVKIEVKDRERVKVEYESDSGRLSNEGMSFLEKDPEAERGELSAGLLLDWRDTELGDPVPDLEVGRIVETRRSGALSLGMILAHVVVAGKNRMLLLQTSGEIWPISTHDVQFVMPKSLVPAELAEQCWSPALLEMWAKGMEVPTGAEESASDFAEMLAARRKAVTMLRKIVRETEKMHHRMLSATPGKGQRAGMEAAWDRFAPADENLRGVTTALQVAEYILNVEDPELPIEVKPNTLPAFAAHQLMMKRSDLFISDERDMWDTGIFLVRSRAERRRISEMSKLFEHSGPAVADFVDKAQKAIQLSRSAQASSGGDFKEVKQNLPAWTKADRSIISILLSPLYETRSTQPSVWTASATSIVKAIGAYPGEDIDRETFVKVLQEIGVLRPWDTLKGSQAQEDIVRALAISGETPPTEGELLKGNELDSLRHDFSHHKVYVVDEGSAGELDDGIAVERVPNSSDHWIHVHIADPTRFIPPGHPLAFRASHQGSTVYLPEGVMPLLPLDRVMSEMSLGAKSEKQATMVFSARIDDKGEIRDSDVRMGWASKLKVVNYDTVDDVLGTRNTTFRPFGRPVGVELARKASPMSEEDEKDLRLLHDVTTRYRTHRMAKTGFDWHIADPSLNVVSSLPPPCPNLYDPKNVPASPRIYTGSPLVDFTASPYAPGSIQSSLDSRAVVAECAILANRVAAHFCNTNKIPVIFRGQVRPKEIDFAGTSSSTIEEMLSKRNQLGFIDPFEFAKSPLGWDPIQLSTSPMEHWSLGFDKPDWGYIRATSPLRRFEDMLVHWQIKSHLAKAKGLSSLLPQMSISEVQTLSKRSAAAERRIKTLSRVASSMWRTQLTLSRLTGPNVPGYEMVEGETVDLRLPLDAHVVGQPIFDTSGRHTKTPVWIPNLGFAVDLMGEHVDWSMGDQVKVIISGGTVHPNPVLTCVLVK